MIRRTRIALFLFCCCVMAQQPPYKNPSLPVDQRVADLLGRMTIEEKAAQLNCYLDSTLIPFAPPLSDKSQFSPARAAKAIPNGIGQIATLGSPLGPRAAAEYRNAIQEWLANTRLGIPAIFHDEGLHGYAAMGGTSYPQAIALGSTWDPSLIEQIMTSVAKEARSRGTQQLLSPVLDLARDPRYGRIEETYGEDPFLASRLGVAAVRGYQGTGAPYGPERVISTAKHYVHGQPEGGTNIAPSSYSERVLREVFLLPFEAAVKEGKIGSIMPSYNEIDGLPSHVNRWLLDQVLRKEWGFQGTTVSDYFAIQQLVTLHHVHTSPASAGADALRSGVDVELPAAYGYSAIASLVREGKIPAETVDAAVARVLRQKFELGLFENTHADPDKAEALPASEEHKRLARTAAERAIILLKNDKDLLPLDPARAGMVAVIGPNTNKRRLGTYSGSPQYFVTVVDAMREKLGAERVLYAEGCRISEPDNGDPMANFMNFNPRQPDPAEERKRIAEAVERARKADTVLLVLGGNETVSREAIGTGFGTAPHLGDVDTLELPGVQNELAKSILELGKPTIVLLLNGRPYSIPYLAANAPAILEGWYLGQETGHAVASVLLGDVNPGGKLPVTIAQNAGQLPVYYYQKPSAKRGYLFSKNEPLYPFGYGLSYTTFRYGAVSISPAKIPANGTAVASIDVTNTGSRAGDEVVQMYVRDEVSSVTRPIKELKGFERIHLKPGETRTVRFNITPDALAFFGRDMKRVVEPGAFQVMIGGSSARTVSGKLEVEP